MLKNLTIFSSLVLLQFYFLFSYNVTIDDNLKSYYNDFNTMVVSHCDKDKYDHPLTYKIIFGDMPSSVTIGYCKHYLHKYEVVINREWFFSHDIDLRTSLMYHELSHCILNVDHSDDPNNYMAPVIPYNMTREQLLKQVMDNINEVCHD